MRSAEVARAVAAAGATAAALGLAVDDTVVVQSSNRLTLRLLPCDVLVRVAPAAHQVAGLEIDVARQLAGVGSPVAVLDPRVAPRAYERDGFVVTFWTYHEPGPAGSVRPADYAAALERLHAGMRRIDVPVPHVTERVDHARHLLASRSRTPALPAADREFLLTTLTTLGRAIGERAGVEQVLHGEPHPGNVLDTGSGLLFTDLETCCRGPVEFDVAHAPADVGGHYPGLDTGLLRDCRVLVLAIATTWRWEPGDQLPDGRSLAAGWLEEIRATHTRPAPPVTRLGTPRRSRPGARGPR